MGLLSLWFSLRGRVDRRAYVLSGVGLMALKYGVDALVVHQIEGHVLTPLEFLSPLLSTRELVLQNASFYVLPLLLWALPFLWIGVAMSVRRSVDAGWSPWFGLLFVLPFINFALIAALSFAPTARQNPGDWSPVEPSSVDRVRSALLGVLAGGGIALGSTLLGVVVLREYGFALFFTTPFVMGAASAYIYNSAHPRSVSSTLGVSVATMAVAGGAILLFALEGAMCIAMAFPIAAVAGIFGAVLGRSIALGGGTSAAAMWPVLLALPVVSAMNKALPNVPGEREVISVVEIDAPPERVWPNVIGFSELPEPSEAIFRIGIAYPTRARIHGEGVGAIRHCEFSTGPFVEPITAWEPPHRLAFDVASQPRPMEEWSPYRHVHPPHLDGYFLSRRGEFRLTALPGGRTRLEGSTWYTLDLGPESYWALWSDALIHQIHLRVLEHVRGLSEAGVEAAVR